MGHGYRRFKGRSREEYEREEEEGGGDHVVDDKKLAQLEQEIARVRAGLGLRPQNVETAKFYLESVATAARRQVSNSFDAVPGEDPLITLLKLERNAALEKIERAIRRFTESGFGFDVDAKLSEVERLSQRHVTDPSRTVEQ